jgi:hypothetical protein
MNFLIMRVRREREIELLKSIGKRQDPLWPSPDDPTAGERAF